MRGLDMMVAKDGKIERVITVYCERGAVLVKNGGVIKLDGARLLQSTGLSDSKGEEIYEGNIVSFNDSIYSANMDDFYEDINTATVSYIDNRFTLVNFAKESLVKQLVGESNTILVNTLQSSIIVGHCNER